jgi:hypothetical protein
MPIDPTYTLPALGEMHPIEEEGCLLQTVRQRPQS